MAYIGAVAPGYDPTRASVPQLDAERFSGNASTTAFTLARQVVSPTDIDVVVENVTQEPTVAYSVNGNTLTFTEAPGTGTNNIYVVYRGSGISNYAFVPDGSITYAKLANNIKQFTVDAVTANGTGTTVELTEAPASANSIIVSVDGVIQTAPTNYTLSGSTITFTGTPDNGANVVVRHIGFRTTSTVTALQASSVTATELADSSVTNAKIVSVANTKISGNIVSSQITSVANTQITGNIASSQITSNPILYGNVSVVGTASIGASDAIMTIGDNRRTVSTSTTTGAIVSGGGLGVWSDAYIGGNLSVAGGQIKFPATQSASTDANTLDDYEEGTWTPVLKFGGATTGITYSQQNGSYIKVGKNVFITLYILLSSKGSATGAVSITGLPFSNAFSPAVVGSCGFDVNYTLTANSGLYSLTDSSSAQLLLRSHGASNYSDLSNTNFNNNTGFYVATTYVASA